jgi:hypothetical protein
MQRSKIRLKKINYLQLKGELNMSDQRSGITQDERRAKTLAIEQLPDADPIELLQKWTKFLAEKVRYDKPQVIADEFIKRWAEL